MTDEQRKNLISRAMKELAQDSLNVRRKKYGNLGAYMRKKGMENAKKRGKKLYTDS